MFATAKKLPAAKKSAKPEVAKIEIEGLQELAALDYLIKTLTALKATVEEDVKADVTNRFIATGAATKTRPANFKANEGIAEASCQLKAKASNIAISAEAEEILLEHNITCVENVSVPACFVINPAYKDDQDVLSKVEEALKKIKDLPEDFIMEQEQQSKKVLPADAIDCVFSSGESEMIRKLLPLVSSIALAPKLATDDVNTAFGLVKDLFEVEVIEA